MRRLYFPLRTSVELFTDPTSVEPAARAKEAVVLYDEVIFEAGFFDITMVGDPSPELSISEWRPPGSLAVEELADYRKPPEPGAGLTLSVGEPPTAGTAASREVMNPLFSGRIATRYVAEWHSDVIEQLEKLNPEWARTMVLDDDTGALEGLKEPIEAAKHSIADSTREIEMEVAVEDFIISALARDSVVAADMEAAFSVTSLFEPFVLGVGGNADPFGRTALGILVPEVGKLPWEAIAEYRQHPGSEDARGKLQEFEERALAAGQDDPLEFQTEVFRSITDDLFAAVDDLRGNVVKDLAAEAAKTGVSFIPVIGPLLGPGASLAQAIGEYMQEQSTWYAALMKLRNG
jgi:hypothetical protein